MYLFGGAVAMVAVAVSPGLVAQGGQGSGTSAAKSAAAGKTSSSKWTVPRTPWGDPDL
jgi:hypothetical protein